MKRILITNDDGFDALGIKALAECVSDLGEVYIVAPISEKSACGHGLVLTKSLRLLEVGKNSYKLEDGAPADCVFIGINHLLKDKKPDIVLSGINLGSNLGEDITYSGTCAGSIESVLRDVPSISFSQFIKNKSLKKDFDFALAKKVARELTKKALEKPFPLSERKFINVNIPHIGIDECKGYKVAEMCRREYANKVGVFITPRNDETLFIGSSSTSGKDRSSFGSDWTAVQNNYVSITPVKLDMTSYEDNETLQSWIK